MGAVADNWQNWLFGAGGVLLAVVVGVSKDWFGGKFKLLLDFLYGRFAGSRLLRRRALAKYTRELYERHGEFSVSFQADEALKLPMESVYVPLRGGESGAEDRTELAVTLRRARRSVVLGQPGAGKTLLLRHESWTWARQRIGADGKRVDLGDLRGIPVLLELHRLNLDPDIGLQQHIVRHFARHRFPRAGTWVSAALDRGDLAVYFDGLDEVATELRPKVVELIKEFADTFPECRIVVTCRAAVYDGQFAEFEKTQTLRIRDFDEHLIRRFLGGWPWRTGAETATGTVEQLLGALRDTPQIMQLARNPLLLTLIAYLYDSKYADTGQALPHTRAEFYRQVVDDLLSDRRRQPAFSRPLKKAVLLRLALTAQDVPSGTRDRLAVPEAVVRRVVRAVLEEEGREAGAAEAVLGEIVERSGLLLAVDGGERYQFAHLTLQEYLAAVALAGDAEGLVRRYEGDPGVWRETVRLWCGVGNGDCTEVVRRAYARDSVLGFLCLSDAEGVEEGFAREVLEEFKGRMRARNAGDEAVAAFGVVAADRRRGELFEFLAEEVRSGNRPAAAALAATNLPRAAEALAEAVRETWDPAWIALETMGDLAVPCFGAWAGDNTEAARMLWRIRTPKSALELNRWLWLESGQVPALYAFFLGELLTVPEIASTLRTAPTPGHDPHDPLHWIWRPFAHSPDDALIRIAGRIAHHLRSRPTLGVLGDLPDPDPRLTAALAVISSTATHLPSQVHVSDAIADAAVELCPELRPFPDTPVRGIPRSEFAKLVEEQHLGTPAEGRALEITMNLLDRAGLPYEQRAPLDLLPPWLRLRACLALLLPKDPAGPETWNVPPPHGTNTSYRKATSPQLIAVLLVWFTVSALAAWRAVTAATGEHPWGPQWLGWAATVVIGLGWLAIASMPVMDEPPAAWACSVVLALLAMAPTTGFYAYLAALTSWGAIPATAITLLLLATLVPLAGRAYDLDSRALAYSHPVRRLVLDPLLDLP